jgi:tetratricopeptide (TPR) repeat protein
LGYFLGALPLASISNGGVDLIHNDAVSLFVSAAKQVQPQVEPSPEDLISIGQIARQVEGLPLALELAASWVRIMPIARIAQELTQGYELLEAELTDIPERHRNLRSILDKTWTALSEKKRETLAKFSVFVGGCTLEAAEAVTKTHYSILLALVNEALLKRTSDFRFDMHPLIRHYAVDKLGPDSTQEAIIQSSHSAYYRTLVRKGGRDLCMGKDYRWQTDYLTDYNNLLAVLNRSLDAIDTEQSLELCAGLWFFWFSNGKFKEGINFCQQALHISSGESEVRAETLNGLGALISRVNLEEGKGYLEQGLAMSQGLGFKYGKQNALFYLSNIAQSQNDLSTAESYMLEALRLRGELGYSVQQCVHNLGNIYYKQGKFQEAEEYYQQALEICQRNNNAYEIAIAQGSLANVAMKCGNYQKAEALLLASRQLYQLSQDKAHLAYTELTLGVVAYHAGNHSKARAFYDTALHMGQEINWTILIANCYLYLALLDYYDGAYTSATHWLERCLALCATNHFTREAVWTNSLFISIYALREPNKALAVAKQAFDLLQGLNAPDDFRLFLEHLLLFLESHNLTTAITLYAIVEMLQDRLNVVRPVFDQRRLDQFKINAQVSVGLEVFNICYQQGKDMKPEAVTTYLDGLFGDFPR